MTPQNQIKGKTFDFGVDNELKFAREQSFFEKNFVIKLLIGLFFASALFLFLHFREVRTEVLEIDSIAPGFIVAQVDFGFFDEKATIIARQEAVRDIGKIYALSEKEIRQAHQQFEALLLHTQQWRQQLPDVSYDDLYHGGELMERSLTQLRFTDPRTLQRLKEQNLLSDFYFVYTPPSLSEPIVIPEHFWELMRKKTFTAENYPPSAAKYIVDFLQEKQWIINEDILTEDLLRKKIQSKVPEKYTSISAGNRIIDQGEKVTSRHIAMLQAMKKALGDSRNLWHLNTFIGSAILTVILTAVGILWLRTNHPHTFSSNRKLFLLVTVMVLTMGYSKVMEFFLLNSKSNLIEIVHHPIFIPFAAILLGSLLNTNIATFASTFLIIISTLTLAFERQGFMIINYVAALVSILCLRTLQHRKEIFIVCAKAWLLAAFVIVAFHLYQNTLWKIALVGDLVSTAIFMLLTAVLVVGFLPLLESAFRIMTDVSLMEYMDPNNDLLRRLSIEAPGTYQHSIVVGNLAETAATAINANGLFCRVATMYHDIGKIATPQYFTENQQGGMNIHQLLTPRESAQVIIAHISEGVALARKAGLPEQFIDIIKEHHGTQLVYYFWHKEQELHPEEADEKDFRYSGPKPHSKESAIIMIADSLEAASRSLDEINEETLMEMANRLVREKADDGQFDECVITYEELSIVKNTLVKSLVAFSHSRVKYPTKPLKGEDLSS